MKILYSINGDGLGHVTRSIPIIKHLKKKHLVNILTSSKRSYDLLKEYNIKSSYYDGLKLFYNNNRLNIFKTTVHNIPKIFFGSTNTKVKKIIKEINPNILITDCDHISTKIAAKMHTPIICICNIHSLSEMKLEVSIKNKLNYWIVKIPIMLFSSKIDYHIITTFFKHPLKNSNSILCEPVLRDEINHANPSIKDYYIVYQTSNTNNKLLDVLKKLNYKFIIYGFDINKVDKNLIYRKNNNTKFFEDLKNCKGCVANGGHTFISEAIALRKPILSIPINSQYEQVLNALEVQKAGYGLMCEHITADIFKEFVSKIPKYKKNFNKIKKTSSKNNEDIFSKLDNLILKYDS